MQVSSLIRALLDPNRVIPGEKTEDRQLQRGLQKLGQELELEGIHAGADSENLQMIRGVLSVAVGAANRGAQSGAQEEESRTGVKNGGPAGGVAQALRSLPKIFDRAIADLDANAQRLAQVGDDLAAASRDSKKSRA